MPFAYGFLDKTGDDNHVSSLVLSKKPNYRENLMLVILLATILLTVAGVLVARQFSSPGTVPNAAAVITVAAIATLALGGSSYPVAHKIAQHGAVSGYKQFLNGTIVSADVKTIRCSEDGPCVHEYDCDAYTVTVVDSAAYTDSNKVYHPEVSHPETRYHDCPYATREYTYSVKDSIKVPDHDRIHVIASHVFSADLHYYRHDSAREGYRFTHVFRGVPSQWAKALQDLKSGNSDPVTAVAKYKNYILASEDTILKSASDNIALLNKQKLLPEHTRRLEDPIHDHYLADKVSFVGYTPDNAAEWQDALMHFNAALGMGTGKDKDGAKQGDMHVVVVKASMVPVSSEDYLNAIKAYWLNGLGKNAIAKNSIILVLAVDDSGHKLEWTKAATGMPAGNGAMLQALSNDMNGAAFDPQTLFGDTTAQISEGKATFTIGSGLVPQTVMVDFPFKRACMGCEGKEDKGQQGFVYLSTEIPLGTTGIIVTVLIDLFIGALLWGAVLYFLGGFDTTRMNVSSNSLYDYRSYTTPSPHASSRYRNRL
jgi:hypothetical protein